MQKMMIFDPQKRITPQQALKHPYFDGFELSKEPRAIEVAADDGIGGKAFFNAANEFNNPGSKPRMESRKDVLSRKSNVNKNSFYKNKAIGKLPEYLPNKPTVVGSRGGIPGSGGQQEGVIRLPNLQSSGGNQANIGGNQYYKNQLSKPLPSFNKYGAGGISANPY